MVLKTGKVGIFQLRLKKYPLRSKIIIGKKIREICTEHDILLIFDEVITGFGRLGAPFASHYFDVIPDMIVCAKGLTSGTVPWKQFFSQYLRSL